MHKFYPELHAWPLYSTCIMKNNQIQMKEQFQKIILPDIVQQRKLERAIFRNYSM